MDLDSYVPERRQHARKSLRTTGQLLLPSEQPMAVHTIDISLGGVAVVLHTDPIKGAPFLFRVTLPHRDRLQVLLQARVVVTSSVFCVTEGGFKVGMRFIELTPAASRALAEFLA